MSLKRNLHILVIPSWYPSHKEDISGSFFREQSLALQKTGNQVGVIYPEMRSLKELAGLFDFQYGPEEQIDEGIPTFRWKLINFTPKFPKIIMKNWVRAGLKLFDLYIDKYGKPDIIQSHSMINGGFLAYQISLKYGIPYVITEHHSFFIKSKVSSKTIQELAPVVEKAEICYGVSNSLSEKLNEIFMIDKWRYMPNIVNNKFLEPNLHIPLAYKFIQICLLKENKRVDLTLKAFSIFLKKYSDIELIIGGDGPERKRLEELSKSLGISENVLFVGELSREQVLYNLSIASCFVLSSDYETFGVVVIEALALGKPVIATKCGGPETILNCSVGRLVEKGVVEELAEAMIYMYENKKSYCAKNIRKYCKSNFSESYIIKKLNEDYNDIFSKEVSSGG